MWQLKYFNIFTTKHTKIMQHWVITIIWLCWFLLLVVLHLSIQQWMIIMTAIKSYWFPFTENHMVFVFTVMNHWQISHWKLKRFFGWSFRAVWFLWMRLRIFNRMQWVVWMSMRLFIWCNCNGFLCVMSHMNGFHTHSVRLQCVIPIYIYTDHSHTMWTISQNCMWKNAVAFRKNRTV